MRTSLVLFGLMLASMTGALTGCNDAERFLEPLPPSQPLAFDPTEPYTMSEWWTNGHQLLRLQADRRYLLYGTTNRYDRPVQIGRWSRQSFACLWFEPYSSLRSERLRVAVSKVDDRIALSIA
ncbi:MAG: hypothetical protein KDA25_09950, partial [Phycisphaerales bacterium]|nr:hypothetical protein [Phycisphaerales bacterium]